MTLLCQKNSYLTEFSKAAIKSIQRNKLSVNGSKTLVDGYDIVLEDTIFFPEGGGQPFDIGTLDGKHVTDVRRNGDQAILFLPIDGDQQEPMFEIGNCPVQQIDWNRRFDHMQQHSAQHLITAIAINQFNLPTTSWSLGTETSFIEMDAKEIPESTIKTIEDTVNTKIRERVNVNVSYCKVDELDSVRFHREIPEDQRSENVRIVSIEGIDRNTCCGTHVSNLGDLQIVKLLFAQKGKKGKSQLYFLAGNRVLKYIANAFKREQSLTTMLKCPSEELVSMVEKTQKTVKRLQKNCLTALRELGKIEAERYLSLTEPPKFFTLHRKEGEFDFISIFMNTIGNDPIISERLILLSVADDSLCNNSGGQILLAGNIELVTKSSELACQHFQAKGSVQRGQFRGRISDVSKLSKLEDLIRSNLNL
ncbi:Alanyl-tRNA editing protein Aarsd1 [Blomia tropicalis]|nr:Alanyl-tRNA editing protein Aarsd1 [Blomia tropicalis]